MGTSTRLGNTTFYNYTDANGNMVNGSSMQLGNTTFHNLNNSKGGSEFGSSLQLGNSSFHNFTDDRGNSIRGSSQQIGNTTFHNLNSSSGKSAHGTTTTIGNSTFLNMSDSDGNTVSGNSSQLGNTAFGNSQMNSENRNRGLGAGAGAFEGDTRRRANARYNMAESQNNLVSGSATLLDSATPANSQVNSMDRSVGLGAVSGAFEGNTQAENAQANAAVNTQSPYDLRNEIRFYAQKTYEILKREGIMTNRAFFRDLQEMTVGTGNLAAYLFEENYELKMAEQGIPEAQFFIGQEYYGKNNAESLKWHMKAAEQGFAPSKCCVGMLYLEGVLGVGKDPERAFEFFYESAKQGWRWAFWWLGGCYASGDFGLVDLPTALEWYKAASHE